MWLKLLSNATIPSFYALNFYPPVLMSWFQKKKNEKGIQTVIMKFFFKYCEKQITILIGCPLEWPAQMFCLGKKICNRFWWLKMSLHLSTSNILIYSVRSMSLLVREFVINHSKSSDKKEHEKNPLETITVHSHIPMKWWSICDWPRFVQILDTLVNMKCQFVCLFPFLCWVLTKPEYFEMKRNERNKLIT